jgi:hypothetical protein
MDKRARATYFPSSDEGFDQETADELRTIVIERITEYLEEHQRLDLPVCLLDFGSDLSYQVGREDAFKEARMKYPPEREYADNE